MAGGLFASWCEASPKLGDMILPQKLGERGTTSLGNCREMTPKEVPKKAGKRLI